MTERKTTSTNRNNIVTLLTRIKKDVGAVGKTDRNEDQGFSFRGVDAVVNAVAAALIAHRVVVVPSAVKDYKTGTVEVGRGRTNMSHATVLVQYTFHAPDGSSLVTEAPGEAMDSGDKATAKAMSVAYRTALLQALTLPTHEKDPDATTYERTNATQVARARDQVKAAWNARGGNADADFNALAADYAQWSGGYPIASASADALDKYRTERLERKDENP